MYYYVIKYFIFNLKLYYHIKNDSESGQCWQSVGPSALTIVGLTGWDEP